ncbi:MAG TPA: NUDIX domain-containing protein [Candidatus Saccharimonadales bacterium]|jgi:mutator protein MutT
MTVPRLLSKASIFIVLRNDAGEILLQQRANTGYHDGYYDFAAGGKVDEGESILEAVVREAAEELGITIDPADAKLVHINQNFIDHAYFNFTFDVTRWQGTPQIMEPEKCSDLRYFPPDRLSEKCTLSVRVNKRAGFGHELTFSKITPAEYEVLMNQEWERNPA